MQEARRRVKRYSLFYFHFFFFTFENFFKVQSWGGKNYTDIPFLTY